MVDDPLAAPSAMGAAASWQHGSLADDEQHAAPAVSLHAILPSGVEVSERRHDADEDLYPEELAYLSRASKKRRAEFTTVRLCARESLGRLGKRRAPLVPGPSGAPTWPEGTVGSMTHCDSYRAAAVCLSTQFLAVGIDAEPHDRLPPGVLEAISLRQERTQVHRLSREVPDVSWDRLLFSAKESVYKVWYPLAGRWLGFHQADVQLSIDGTFEATLNVRLPAAQEMPGRNRVRGRWACDAGHILTAITMT